MPATRSPYEVALGARAEELHPRLRLYFSAIPEGHVGIGRGTFSVAGVPSRGLRVWLRPVLALLAREQILFPAWGREVPFRVRNRADRDGVVAERELGFLSGPRTMLDRVSVVGGVLVDDVGVHRRFRAEFAVAVEAGALVLTSTRMRVRLRRRHVTIPGRLAPRIRLVESADEAADRQHVDVTLDVPLLGRLYEYRGTFEYRVANSGLLP